MPAAPHQDVRPDRAGRQGRSRRRSSARSWLITLAAVWWRYVLNAPLAWTEQVSRMLFVWITFVGAAVLYREQLHIAIDMFIAMLPRARAAVVCAGRSRSPILAFILVLFVYGLKLVDRHPRRRPSGALDITPASFYFAAPVAAGDDDPLLRREASSTPARRATIEVRAGARSSV